MELLKIIALSFGSLLWLFVLTKLMGNREMSQLTMFDYIVGITIGSIAAEMSTSLENNFWEPVIAMTIYAGTTILISYITSKSVKIRKIITGESTVLLNDDKLYYKNFKQTKMDMNDFLMQCRAQGYFNISDLATVFLEPNGKLSILPKADNKPATPKDLNLSPDEEKFTYNVILDGRIIKEALNEAHKDEKWLLKELKRQKIKDTHKVFLGVVDKDSNLAIYKKN